MAIGLGSRIGPYEVTALLGEGGMGKVWRAHHSGLKRDDALKVLPDAFASDADRLARFRREAQVLASLNHPNIAHVHGLEQADDVQALVMELVEGPTLADRIARGPVPVDEALPIARQIAEALEAAHEQGIIHRDLKPANIKVRSDGTVKVLDFGLAKALEPLSGRTIDAAASPTITSPAMMTGVGMLLGTAAYMSPEQARGKAVDKRSDIWAFGCVLYEMLSGKRAFVGEEVSDTLAAVLRGEPDWAALPPMVPRSVALVLRRCLEKDPKRRLHDIADAQILTEEISSLQGQPPSSSRLTSWSRHAIRVAVASTLLCAGAAIALLVTRLMTGTAARVERFEIVTPRDAAFTVTAPGPNVVLSPDGSQVVYHVETGGPWRLALRKLDRLEQMVIPATEAGLFPVFSPDGAQLAFVSRRRLMKVAVSGGPATLVCELTAEPVGLSWDMSDVIVFAERGNGVFRVPTAGGKPERLATPDPKKGERDYFAPQLLPGGKTILFTIIPVEGTVNQARIAARVLATEAVSILVEGAGPARYIPTGHLVYNKAGNLMAAPLDIETLSIGSSAVVQQGVLAKGAIIDGGAVNVSVGSDGSMIYAPGRTEDLQRVIWVDRQGARLAPLTDQRLVFPRYPRLSPDGRRLAITIGPGNEGHIWIYDLTGASQPLKLTYEGHNTFSTWAPSGTHIVFASTAQGRPAEGTRTFTNRNLFRLPSDASRLDPERLTSSPNLQIPFTWSPHSEELLFREIDAGLERLWRLPLTGNDRKPRLWIGTHFVEDEAVFSPNGKWVAYVTDQTGSPEVVVRPFPGPGSPIRVSPGGGHDPVWSRNGMELFYQNGGELMSAEVIAWEPELRFGPARPLFKGGFVPYATGTPRTYDVAPDGRFVMIEPNEADRPASLVLVKNWFEELKRLVPAN